MSVLLRNDSAAPADSPELEALARQVQRDLALLDYPGRAWVSERRTRAGESIRDVIIVGAGQGGLAAAFGLRRERVQNVLLVDDNPLDRAGPWLNFARMRTLRTPKYVTGPDLGIPSLTPRAWYEAQFGEHSWATLGLIPKEMWAAYLGWYRRTLGLSVLAETRVGALSYDASERAWRVPCTGPQGTSLLWARRVILATGIDGSGAWHIPPMIREALPRQLYAHTRESIDFAALRGKRIAVLGAGASAFDNAALALDAGAAQVRLYFRRKQLVQVNAYRWAEFVGFLRHVGDLPDEDRWKFMSRIVRMGQLPPADTYQRACASPSFHLQPGAAWKSVALRNGVIELQTEAGAFEADFVIVGTGFVTDLRERPELQLVEADIARWADRYTPSPDNRNEDLSRHPYLGPGFEFIEREPGAAPHLAHLYNYTFGGLLSLGFGGASISGMKYSIPRLVGAVTRSFFLEERSAHFDSLRQFSEREF